MKKLNLLPVVLSAGALFGQAPSHTGGESRVQIFGDLLRPSDQAIAQTSFVFTDQADTQTGFGIRFMGEIPGTNNWFYQLGGRLESTTNFNKTVTTGLTVDATDVSFGYSYWSVGGGYMWHFGDFTLGTHLEGRGEALSVKGDLVITGEPGSGAVDHKVTYLRPWFRVSGDWSWKAGSVTPFVGADLSLAIFKSSQNKVNGLVTIDDRNLKAMAPNTAFGFYIGLKF